MSRNSIKVESSIAPKHSLDKKMSRSMRLYSCQTRITDDAGKTLMLAEVLIKADSRCAVFEDGFDEFLVSFVDAMVEHAFNKGVDYGVKHGKL